MPPSLTPSRKMWDNPIMTVNADSKKRVVVPDATKELSENFVFERDQSDQPERELFG